jgi:hypothetical protein
MLFFLGALFSTASLYINVSIVQSMAAILPAFYVINLSTLPTLFANGLKLTNKSAISELPLLLQLEAGLLVLVLVVWWFLETSRRVRLPKVSEDRRSGCPLSLRLQYNARKCAHSLLEVESAGRAKPLLRKSAVSQQHKEHFGRSAAPLRHQKDLQNSALFPERVRHPRSLALRTGPRHLLKEAVVREVGLGNESELEVHLHSD